MSKNDPPETSAASPKPKSKPPPTLTCFQKIQLKLRHFFNLDAPQPEPIPATTIFLRNMLTGGVSASIAVTTMAPIERIKLILQVQSCTKRPIENHYRGLMDALTRIPKEQGILSFWRGNFASVIRGFPYQALNFAFRDKFKDYFTRGLDRKTQFKKRFAGNLLAGGIAGSTSMAILYPLDYARTRMAMDFGKCKDTREYKSLRGCILNTYRNDGIRGVYRGFWFSLMGVFIYRSAYFGLFDTAKDLTPAEYRHTILISFLTAELAATFSGFISYPFDTVRRSMMMQSGKVGTDKFYESSTDCIQKIWKTKGTRGFFNGAFTNVIRGTGGAIMLVLYDEIQYAVWRRPIILKVPTRSRESEMGATPGTDVELFHDKHLLKHKCPKGTTTAHGHGHGHEHDSQCPVRTFAERVNLICDF